MVGKLTFTAMLITLAALTNARTLPNRSKQVKVYSYVLPAGAEEIRDDINHSFACANRTDGFYVDIPNDCQIFHRCQDNARFSFICAERTVFSQMYQTCVHDGQLGYPCEDSAQYYPEGEGYEPPAEEPYPQEQTLPERQVAPSMVLETPQTPSKVTEMIVTHEHEVMRPMQPMRDSIQPSQQPETAEDKKDELDQQEDQDQHHQINADLFDSVEEDADSPTENSAHEVMDDGEQAPSIAPSEQVTSNTSNGGEESNEVEIMDDTPQQQFASADPLPSSLPSELTPEGEVTREEFPEKTENHLQDTPAASETSVFQEKEQQYEGDALLNAVQMVEELEPIVHELAPESGNLVSHAAEMSQDSVAPAEHDTSSHEDNEVLPETGIDVAIMETAPSAHMSAASSPPAEGEGDSDAIESGLQVNDLTNGATVADTIDDSSETVAQNDVDTNEAEIIAPEAADVKPIENEADDVVELSSMPGDGQRPLESPAIVEEMTPLRPMDSVELPELIVSTEFHLDAVTQGPPIRRRKTFLFRADAIRKRQ